MRTKILIIDNYDSFTFNLLQLIEEEGRCDYVLLKNDEITAGNVHRCDKILISPGPGIPAKAGGILDLIASTFRTKSILGVCLGHQAIAQVFGGTLVRLPEVAHGITKEITIRDTTEYIFESTPRKFEVGLYHSWTVSPRRFPPCLRVTASSKNGSIMAIAHKEYDVRGLQFHPESVMTKYGRQIISNWLRH